MEKVWYTENDILVLSKFDLNPDNKNIATGELHAKGLLDQIEIGIF